MTIIWAVALLFVLGCAPSMNLNSKTTGDNIILSQEDENEYDIIIDDPQFSSWLAAYGYPQEWHDNTYYRNKNNILVSEWNSRFYDRGGRFPYTFNIIYDYSTDYGFDVNYQLFHYFRYLSQKYRISLPGV